MTGLARRAFAIRKREIRAIRGAKRERRVIVSTLAAQDARYGLGDFDVPATYDVNKPTGRPPVLCALGFVVCVMCVGSVLSLF